MQSLVVVTEPGTGSQRLARIVPPSQSRGDRGPTPDVVATGAPSGGLSLAAFQEQMAFTYFFGTYSWAGFWKPFLQLAREVDDLAQVSHTGALALAYGHMGLGHKAQSLQSQGLELYCQSLHEVQSLLTQRSAGDKTDVARLAVPVVILGCTLYVLFLMSRRTPRTCAQGDKSANRAGSRSTRSTKICAFSTTWAWHRSCNIVGRSHSRRNPCSPHSGHAERSW